MGSATTAPLWQTFIARIKIISLTNKMYKECIICGGLPDELVLNNLAMRKCRGCGLIWRKNFDISLQHYVKKDRDLSQGKQERRFSNCQARVETFGKYINLNNLCDVGCAEGMFLKALRDFGYKNAVGIEPSASDEYAEFAKENHLNIQRGAIKDIGEIINKHNIRTVTMFHVIEHLENPLESLKIIYDNMTPGSHLVVEVPNTDAQSLKKSNYEHEHLIYPEHLFYFNEKNLKLLLEKIGFKITARGKRDFNPKVSLNISESLFRLGLWRKNIHSNEYKAMEIRSPVSFRPNNLLTGKIRDVIRFILNRIIIISGRQDIMWMIARK